MVQTDVATKREELLYGMRAQKNAMAPYLFVLRDLARWCNTCVEFGVRRGGSTVGLLSGCENVLSVDIEWLPRFEKTYARIARLWPGWVRHSGDSVKMAPMLPQEFDLLLHDSLHTYDQVDAELTTYADRVRKYLVFHDSLQCGSYGGGLNGPDPGTMGIRPAIDKLMARDPSWRVHAHLPEREDWTPSSAGLLVLKRHP